MRSLSLSPLYLSSPWGIRQSSTSCCSSSSAHHPASIPSGHGGHGGPSGVHTGGSSTGVGLIGSSSRQGRPMNGIPLVVGSTQLSVGVGKSEGEETGSSISASS